MQKFDDQSYDPKYNAQRNLQGRTHYVDDATLRCFRSRVLLTAINFDGLLFGLVESVSLNPNHTARGKGLEDCRKTRAAAEKDMRRTMQSVDALAHTLAAIAEQKRAYGRDLDAFAREIIENKKVA